MAERTLRGTRMNGQYGNARITVQNLNIGTAADGKLSLSGDDAVLTGSYDKDSAAGTVTADGPRILTPWHLQQGAEAA